ncbi:hypothetical protein ALC53_08954 [Atta colombica]|uniref:Uncharacterized protein n=1 Tax=Atta colombica TaxID=520822 RepID=A0A151I1V8_9HYME|nr:hypothetical protein ALC53_08954 [Atta colombica]
MCGGRNSFFKTFASLTEGTILRGGFAVFIPGVGVAKLLDRLSPRPGNFIPRPFIDVHRQRSSDFEPSVGPIDRLKTFLKPSRIPPWRVSTVGYFSYWIETNNVRVYMGDYDRLSFCKTVHCSQVFICPQQAATTTYNERGLPSSLNERKNRHERQRWQSASRAGNGVRGQPPNLVKNFAVSLEFQARLLGHNSQARTRRRKTRRNLRKRRLHDCLFLWPLHARERENSHSTCCRETISEFSNDSEVGGAPMPVRGLKETRGIGSYPLVRLSVDRLLFVWINHGRYRRVNNIALSFCPKSSYCNSKQSRYTHCDFIDNKSQFFAAGFNAGDFKNYDARKTSTQNEKDKDDNDDEYLRNNTMSAKSWRTYFRRHNSSLALSYSPLISIINDLRSPPNATAPDLRNDKNVFAGTVSATESRQGENKNVSGNGGKEEKDGRAPIYDRARTLRGPSGTHGGPLSSHFLSNSRVPPVISHYALATNGDANSVSATASLEGGKKGGGRGRKNGPFNGLIDLLPRRPTVVMVRNENVTLYRHLKPWQLTSRTMRSLFAK